MRRTTVARHDGEYGSWVMVACEPHPGLRAHVRRYCGYEESTLAPLRRTEPANADIPVIVSLGPAIDVDGRRHTSFVAGVHDRQATTAHDGRQRGIQIDISPIAAGMLLGVPMHELANRSVGLEDVLGPAAVDLRERLIDAASWHARFDLLDDLLGRRLDEARRPPPSVAWAWGRLRATRGRIAVGALAAELGCSPRLLELQFREHLGAPPKTLGRILRFEHAMVLLQRDDGARFAEIAEGCGYYDQAHMNRDFRAFAGAPPGELLARRLPDGGGVEALAAEFASVQDAPAVAA
jgi:AraC-like DNA-binding protein